MVFIMALSVSHQTLFFFIFLLHCPPQPSALLLLVSILCFHDTRIPLPPLEISSSSLQVPSLSTLHIPVQIPHMRVSAVLVFLNLVSFVKITSISNHFPENNMI